MRILNIVFVFFFSFQFTLAQEKDSVAMHLMSYTSLDTIRSEQLIEASNYFTYSNPKRALDYINEGLIIAKEQNWKKGEALALNQKGTIYYTMANNLKALDYFLEALDASKQINNQTLTINVYNNLANIYADMKDFDKALENYNKCLNIATRAQDTINQIRAFNNMGNVYSETQRVDKSLTYFNEALFLAQALGHPFFVAAITNNKGLAYKRKADYKNALKYYDEALRRSRKINNKYIEATALNSLGKVSILQQEFSQAKIYADKALRVSKAIDAVEWQADSWLVLNQVYENEGKYNQSLSAYKNYITLRDSVYSEEKSAELTKKDMQYQLDKQETTALAEIKHQTFIKNTAIGTGGVVLLFLVGGYFLYNRKRDAEFKTKMAETELKALCSQMNPHFIFNALNSISHYLQTNNVEKADAYLAKFSTLTRAILENSEKKWIPICEDLELLKLYIDIESLRLKNKLWYHILIDENIDIENTLIPPLILQPFIENSIWHGISNKDGDGSIVIEIKSTGKKLICAVEDDGAGRSHSIKNSNSMGIKITNQRLDIINQIKQVKGTIRFIDKKQGLRVELSLPLELKF